MSVSKCKNFMQTILVPLNNARHRKKFVLFWNKLSNMDRKRVILLIGIDHKPIPSLSHLKAELFLVKNCYSEEWTYGGIE